MNPPLATAQTQIVLFRLEDQQFAVALDRVERVVPMVALRPFPKAPAIVRGLFILHGEPIPVISARRRLRLPERPLRTSDQLLMVRTPRRRLALWVDHVENVVELPVASLTSADALVPGLNGVRGIARLPQGVVFVHDIDQFLSLEEEAALATALEEQQP